MLPGWKMISVAKTKESQSQSQVEGFKRLGSATM